KASRAEERATLEAEERAERTAANAARPAAQKKERGRSENLDPEIEAWDHTAARVRPLVLPALPCRRRQERNRDAEEQDALRCEQALPRDRLGQDPAREDRQAPQPGEEALQGHPAHERYDRGRQGRR